MDQKQKKEKEEEQHNWDELSENEDEEHDKKKEVKEERVVEKRVNQLVSTPKPEAPKKVYLKTKTGDIVIDKLDAYIEPVKMCRETRGDVSKIVFYNRTSK